VKNHAVAGVAAIAAAVAVGIAWLALFISAYATGRYNFPFLTGQIDQLLVSLAAASLVFGSLLYRRQTVGAAPASRLRTVAVALTSAAAVAGSVSVFWVGLWTWMARYYSPTHTRIDVDIPQWSLDPLEVVIVIAAIIILVALALVPMRHQSAQN